MCDELENYHTLLSCSCLIPYSYSVVASVQKYQEQDYVIHFLKGLNEKLTPLKSHIMMMNLIPYIDKVFSLVIQQEIEMNYSSSALIPCVGISK